MVFAIDDLQFAGCDMGLYFFVFCVDEQKGSQRKTRGRKKGGECGPYVDIFEFTCPFTAWNGRRVHNTVCFYQRVVRWGGAKRCEKRKRGPYLSEGDSIAESCVSTARGHFTFSLFMARSITRFFLNLAFL